MPQWRPGNREHVSANGRLLCPTHALAYWTVPQCSVWVLFVSSGTPKCGLCYSPLTLSLPSEHPQSTSFVMFFCVFEQRVLATDSFSFFLLKLLILMLGTLAKKFVAYLNCCFVRVIYPESKLRSMPWRIWDISIYVSSTMCWRQKTKYSWFLRLVVGPRQPKVFSRFFSSWERIKSSYLKN